MPKKEKRKIYLINNMNDVFNIFDKHKLVMKNDEFHNIDIFQTIGIDIARILYICSLFFVMYMDAIKENVESRVKKLNIDQPSAQKSQRFKLTTPEKKSVYFSWKGNDLTREEAFNEYKMATINQITNAKKGKRITEAQERKFKKQFIQVLRDMGWRGLYAEHSILPATTGENLGKDGGRFDIRFGDINVGGSALNQTAKKNDGSMSIWSQYSGARNFQLLFDTLYRLLLPDFKLLKWLNKIYFQYVTMKTWDKKVFSASYKEDNGLTYTEFFKKADSSERAYHTASKEYIHPVNMINNEFIALLKNTAKKNKPIANQVYRYWKEVLELNKKELDDLIKSELELKTIKDVVAGLVDGVEMNEAIEKQQQEQAEKDSKALDELLETEKKNITLLKPKKQRKPKVTNKQLKAPPPPAPKKEPPPPATDMKNIDEFPIPRIDKKGNRIYKIMSRLFFGEDPKSKGGYAIKKEMTLLDTMKLIEEKGYYISPAQKKTIMNNNNIGLGKELATKYDKNTFEIYKKDTGKTDRLYLVKMKHTDSHGRQTNISLKQDDAIDKIVMTKKAPMKAEAEPKKDKKDDDKGGAGVGVIKPKKEPKKKVVKPVKTKPSIADLEKYIKDNKWGKPKGAMTSLGFSPTENKNETIKLLTNGLTLSTLPIGLRPSHVNSAGNWIDNRLWKLNVAGYNKIIKHFNIPKYKDMPPKLKSGKFNQLGRIIKFFLPNKQLKAPPPPAPKKDKKAKAIPLKDKKGILEYIYMEEQRDKIGADNMTEELWNDIEGLPKSASLKTSIKLNSKGFISFVIEGLKDGEYDNLYNGEPYTKEQVIKFLESIK